jgi:hypothetical protein
MPWFIRRIFTLLGTTAASAWAFTTVAVYALLWVIFDPGSFNWHAIATLAVWCMTLFIQRGEHRDTQAIHAKLDELLKGHPNASDRLTRGRINLLGDAPEPAVISQRVRIFVHAPDYLAVLNDDVIELVAIGWRGKAGWS